MFKNLRKKKKGFTLIELIIVIAIIAILAAVAIPKFGSARRSANNSADLSNAKIISNATSLLIADGTITIPSAGTEKIIIGGTNGTEETKKATKIQEYLENVPKTGAGGNFTVEITTDGNVSVTDGTNPIYPIQ